MYLNRLERYLTVIGTPSDNTYFVLMRLYLAMLFILLIFFQSKKLVRSKIANPVLYANQFFPLYHVPDEILIDVYC